MKNICLQKNCQFLSSEVLHTKVWTAKLQEIYAKH